MKVAKKVWSMSGKPGEGGDLKAKEEVSGKHGTKMANPGHGGSGQ